MPVLARIRRLLCMVLRDHGSGPPRRVMVGPQSPLGGRDLRCGRCGQVLAHYYNDPQGRLS